MRREINMKFSRNKWCHYSQISTQTLKTMKQDNFSIGTHFLVKQSTSISLFPCNTKYFNFTNININVYANNFD